MYRLYRPIVEKTRECHAERFQFLLVCSCALLGGDQLFAGEMNREAIEARVL